MDEIMEYRKVFSAIAVNINMSGHGWHYVWCVAAHVCLVLSSSHKISDFTDVSYSGSFNVWVLLKNFVIWYLSSLYW